MDPRSPPEPLTQSTSTVSPVSGSAAGSLADVLPPPKLVMRRSDPRRLERYRSSSSSESVAAASLSHRSAIPPPPVGRRQRGLFRCTRHQARPGAEDRQGWPRRLPQFSMCEQPRRAWLAALPVKIAGFWSGFADRGPPQSAAGPRVLCYIKRPMALDAELDPRHTARPARLVPRQVTGARRPRSCRPSSIRVKASGFVT